MDTCRRVIDGKPSVPKLSSKNLSFLPFWHKIAYGLFQGQGGYDYGAIDLCFRVYGVPRSAQVDILDKTLIMIQAHAEETAKRMEKREL